MTLSLDDRYLLTVARDLAERAASEVRARIPTAEIQSRKSDDSPVTEADLVSDKVLREGLREAYPDHAILTEEDGLSGESDSPWVWCIDPLDGTKAFAKKIPGFCVMVGLLYQGQPYLGVVVDPLEGHAYEAIRGQGAYHSFQGRVERLHVSSRQDFSKMPLIVSTGFPDRTLAMIREKLSGPVLSPINSVGIKVGLLVRQHGDIYINHHGVHYWDTCAPQVILEEAGGIFTRLDGLPLKYDLKTGFSHESKTLASNNTRHDELVSQFQHLSF